MIEYIPILTTILSFYFFVRIFKHYLLKPKAIYLLWWTVGVLTFGLGTLTESINALFGWSEVNTKIWYIVGALLGGFPLAQGTVYLLLNKKTANILTVLFSALIIAAALFVWLSPISLLESFDYRLTGAVLEWKWVRSFSPFINIYSLIFLVGGAIYSAILYKKKGKLHSRFLGNIFIAVGGLLPGIGGTFTRFGYVEVLYITEFIGLSAIYFGYVLMRNDKEITIHDIQLSSAREI